jgi:hypothetical protein
MSESLVVRRPISIKIICIVGLFGALFAIPAILSPLARAIGAWYPPYLAFSAVTGTVCLIGLWRMKKWAAYTYTGFAAVNQIVLLSMGVWNVAALLVPGVVVFFAMTHLGKMS